MIAKAVENPAVYIPNRRFQAADCRSALPGFGKYVDALLKEGAHDDIPWLYFPTRNDALRHIRVVSGEVFHNRNIFYTEYEQCAVGRITQRARQRNMSSVMSLPDQLEMPFPIRLAAFSEVLDNVVKQREIFHYSLLTFAA